MDQVRFSPMTCAPLGSAEAGRLARALAALDDAGPGDDHPARIAGMPVIRRLGAGGMGEVFEAEQTAPRRRIALKLLRPDLPLAAAGALEREIAILGRLEHPAIARIYTAGLACIDGADRPWFAMELVDGRPITDFARAQRLPLRPRLELMRAVYDAVQHAHDLGIIHLDLKPSNVLVDARGEVRILDFGIARLLGDQPAPALCAGTPGFAAPEQLAGAAIDARADVHGLGALLRALTADLPEAAPSQLAVVITKATAPDPRDRYAAPRALAADLARLLTHRPVLGHPAPIGLRTRLLLRRRRMPLAIAAAALLAATAGASLWLGEAHRAAEAAHALGASKVQRVEAEQRADRAAILAEQERRTAESQAALARFGADLLDMSRDPLLTSAPGAPVVTTTPSDAMRLELQTGLPLDMEAMSDIIRLQSALLADPHNDALRRELHQRAMALVAGGAAIPEPPPGVRSFHFEHSRQWSETTRIDPDH